MLTSGDKIYKPIMVKTMGKSMIEEKDTYTLGAKVSKSTYDYFQRMAEDFETSASELIRGILVGIQMQAPSKEDVVNKYNVKRSESA